MDEAALPDGDLTLLGVEERTVFSAAGMVASAQNCRFRFKRATTRDGITILPWGLGNGLTPFTDVYGGFVFANENGSEQYIVVAANGGVYYTRPNGIARAVKLPKGVTLTKGTFKRFIQANASLILLRGIEQNDANLTTAQETLRPLKLSPNSDGNPDWDTGFQYISQENIWPATLKAATNRVFFPANNLLVGDPVQFAGNGQSLPAAVTAGQTYFVLATPSGDEFTISAAPGGTQLTWNTIPTDSKTYAVEVTVLDGAYPIPEANDGMFAQNRLFLINGKDTLAVSDIGDFTRYVPTQSTFRINSGDAYTLVYTYLFNADTLLCFKDGNVSKVTGVSGDLSGAVGPLNVTQAYGMAAASVADIGTDVFWLSSELRITSLQLTQFNLEQGNDAALNDPLIQTFGRINPGAASAARLAVFDSYLLVALPLDDATVLGTVNVVPAGSTYTTAYAQYGGATTGYSTTVTVTAGQEYLYSQGENDQLLVNGSEILEGDCTFTATGTTVTLVGYIPTAWPITATVVPAGGEFSILPTGAEYTGDYADGFQFVQAVVAGESYTYTQGANDAKCFYGPGQYLSASGSFTAVTDTITLTSNVIYAPVTATLLPVVASGVNTGVAVYDFLNQAWAGTDEAPGITCVVDWLKFKYNGRDSLGFIGADGYLHLYNDGYEDETVAAITPYADVLLDVLGQVTGGMTFQVGDGTTITLSTGATVNSGTTWGVGPIGSTVGRQNLWADANGQGGYNPAATSPWNPGTGITVEQIDYGVRFINAGGTTAPVVKVWGSTVANGYKYWALVDSHQGNEIQSTGINMHLTSRAYPCKSWATYAMIATTGGRMDFKGYSGVKLHLGAWSPNYTIQTLTQGQNDFQPYVTAEQRDYLKFLAPADAAAWARDNSNDDFNKSGREDYAYPETGTGIFLGSGINFDALQQYPHSVPLSERGLFVQLDITNTAGRLEIWGVEMEAQTGESLSGVQIKG